MMSCSKGKGESGLVSFRCKFHYHDSIVHLIAAAERFNLDALLLARISVKSTRSERQRVRWITWPGWKQSGMRPSVLTQPVEARNNFLMFHRRFWAQSDANVRPQIMKMAKEPKDGARHRRHFCQFLDSKSWDIDLWTFHLTGNSAWKKSIQSSLSLPKM